MPFYGSSCYKNMFYWWGPCLSSHSPNWQPNKKYEKKGSLHLNSNVNKGSVSYYLKFIRTNKTQEFSKSLR